MNEIIMLPADNLSFLPGIHRWGIEIIKLIQRIENPVLTMLTKGITALGTELLYVPIILLIFWCIDEKQGLRLGILLIVSAWINAYLKELLKLPRPFHLEPALGLVQEKSYGLPSGHAQMSITFWVPLALWRIQVLKTAEKLKKKQRLIWTEVIIIILLVGFTRLYLGVHFPTDLLAGWIIGGILLVFWFFLSPRAEKLFARAGQRSQNIAAAAIALAMNGLYPGDYPALFLGFCLGYTIMKKNFPFSAQENVNGKKPGLMICFFRCFTGFLGMAILYLGLKLLLPGEESLLRGLPFLYELGHFLRYGLLGFWASAGAPWLFYRIGLSMGLSDGTASYE